LTDWRQNFERLDGIYRSIHGGAALLDYLGEVPDFHDGEIISLELNRKGASFLKIHTWSVKLVERKYDWTAARHAIVTFTMEQVTDLQLDGFSHQNVINGLMIERAAPPPDRVTFIGTDDLALSDFEINLEPCFGMDGRIRCKDVEITFVPHVPKGSLYEKL